MESFTAFVDLSIHVWYMPVWRPPCFARRRGDVYGLENILLESHALIESVSPRTGSPSRKLHFVSGPTRFPHPQGWGTRVQPTSLRNLF